MEVVSFEITTEVKHQGILEIFKMLKDDSNKD